MNAAAPKRDYAAEALETLRSAVLAEAPALKAEVESYARALRDLHAASDLMPGMQAAVAVALAVEALGKAAAAVREATRAALVRCFDETGCPGVMTRCSVRVPDRARAGQGRYRQGARRRADRQRGRVGKRR